MWLKELSPKYLRDLARPKSDIMRLCATEITAWHCMTRKYVGTIATINGYVPILCDRNKCETLCDPKQICCDFVRTKKSMLRPLRLKMGMLRFCAIEIIARHCATQNRYNVILCVPKKVCCDHCDSIVICCDFVRSKNMRDFAQPKTDMVGLPESRFAICVSTDSNEKWYVLTVSTQDQSILTDSTQQVVYFVTMFDRGRTFQPSWTEDKTFRPSSTKEKRPCCEFALSKLAIMPFCATRSIYLAILRYPKELYCDSARTKLGMLRLCATKIRYFATLCLKMGCCDFARQKKFYATLCEPKKICRDFVRPKLGMLRLCATQIGYVAILRDTNLVYCENCDSKWVCCNLARQKKFYGTLSDPKKICCDFARPKFCMLRPCATQNRHVATIATQNGYVATLCDRNIYATWRDPN